MTVQTSTNVAAFVGNGVTTSFPIGFKFNSSADLIVEATNTVTGVTTTLSLNSDYTVTGAGDENGGTIAFTAAPLSTETVKVTRHVDLLQLTDLRNQGKFYAEVHEDVFDKLVMIDQQQQTEINDSNAKSDEAVATANSANAKSDQAIAKADQNLIDMQAQYDAFEQGAAFVVIGDYATGLVVDGYNKVFRKDGEFYRAAASLSLPYTLTGDWLAESTKFVSVGDAVLRQELVAAGGSEMVGFQITPLTQVVRTVSDKIGELVSVKDFGATGDGVTDDRAAIQAAIDYVLQVLKGGTLYFPPTGSFYRVASEHPDYPGHALAFIPSLEQTSTQTGSIKFVGCGQASKVVLDTSGVITSLLYWPKRLNHMKLSGLWFDAASKASTCWSAATEYSPYLFVEDCDFRGATGTQVELATFVSVMNRVRAQLGVTGFNIRGVDSGPVTSLTMTGCYGLNNTGAGFDFGYLTYCTLNSCAVDESNIAYKFTSAYGVTMNACGAERINQFLYATNARGFQLNSPTALNIGGESAPVTYGIEFVTGLNVTIAGLQFITQRAGGLTYKLGLTGSGYGSENITVLDRSVMRSEAFWISNFRHVNPIKFLGDDKTEKAETIQITTESQFRDQVGKLLLNKRLDHDIVLQLADGAYTLSGNTVIEGLHGGGSLTIQGNASNRASVSIDANYRGLTVKNCSARVIFKDLTVTSTLVSTLSIRLLIEGSRVILQNVLFNRNGINTGSAVQALLGSHVTIDPTTETETVGGWSAGSWVWDDTSTIHMSPRGSVPTTGHWEIGMRFYRTVPTAGGNAGHLVTTSGAPGTWKTFAPIAS